MLDIQRYRLQIDDAEPLEAAVGRGHRRVEADLRALEQVDLLDLVDVPSCSRSSTPSARASSTRDRSYRVPGLVAHEDVVQAGLERSLRPRGDREARMAPVRSLTSPIPRVKRIPSQRTPFSARGSA